MFTSFIFSREYFLNRMNYCDGLELLKTLSNGVVDVCFFDPQYDSFLGNVDSEDAKQSVEYSFPQMSDLSIRGFVVEIDRVLRPSAHLFFWVGKSCLLGGIYHYLKGTSLQVVDMVIWDKTNLGVGTRLGNQYEYLFVLQKKPLRAKVAYADYGIGDVYQESVVSTHPFAKPVGLQRLLLEAISSPLDVVVDPCAGSFSVLKVCQSSNRTFLGCDLVAL